VTSEAERQFHRDMVLGVECLKRKISYNATRFMEMVGELGGVEAARQLLRGRDASDGFTILWEHGRLEMSVEAFVLYCRGTGSCSPRSSRRPPAGGCANTDSTSSASCAPPHKHPRSGSPQTHLRLADP
jgi:hypothetical protein